MPAVIKHDYLDRNHGKAFILQHVKKKITAETWRRNSGGHFGASKEIFDLPEKKSVYSIPWHASLGDTVSALFDLDTESSGLSGIKISSCLGNLS